MIAQLKSYKYSWIISYLLLCYLASWQAFSLLKIEETEGAKYLAFFSIFVFYVLLSQINARLLKVVLIVSFLFAAFYYPVLKTYGRFNNNFVASLFYTNTGEAWSYLKVVSIKVYVTLAVLLIYTLILLKCNYKKWRLPYFKLGLLVLLAIPPLVTVFKMNQQEKELKYFTHLPLLKIPLVLSEYVLDVYTENKEIIQASQLPDDWEILNKDQLQLKENFVVVIGESVRKDILETYGFPISNTPFMSSSANIQFDNYLSVSSHTVPSLTRTIVHSADKLHYSLNNNMVNLAKKAGYETYWLSNQGYIGVYDSPISIIANASDHYQRLTGGDFTKAKSDKELLPIFSSILNREGEKPKMIFVHMVGSHPEVCDRTDGYYSDFYVSEEISCYIETIRMLDAFLATIKHELEAKKESYQLVYFSDHGLVIDQDNNIVHGSDVREVYQVPLLLWGDDIPAKQHVQAARNGNHLLDLFCELNNIKTNLISPSNQFLSEESSDESVDAILNIHGKLTNYLEYKNNPIPRPTGK